VTDQTPTTVPDEWLLAAAISAYNDGRDRLEDFDGDDLGFLSDGLAAVIPLVRAEQAAELERAQAAAALLSRAIDAIEVVLRSSLAAYRAGDAEAGVRLIAEHVAEVDAT
jgi:hypothetical protein